VTRDIYTPPGGPPAVPTLPREILAEVGEAGVRRLLQLHYERLGASAVHHLFPPAGEALRAAAERSADFFVQLLGGPRYYTDKYGAARMRARHVPFAIDEAARREWLRCFRGALDALPFPAAHRPVFELFLDRFSAWMINTADPGGPAAG